MNPLPVQVSKSSAGKAPATVVNAQEGISTPQLLEPDTKSALQETDSSQQEGVSSILSKPDIV